MAITNTTRRLKGFSNLHLEHTHFAGIAVYFRVSNHIAGTATLLFDYLRQQLRDRDYGDDSGKTWMNDDAAVDTRGVS